MRRLPDLRSLRRAAALVLLCGVALLLGAGPAWAHSRLVSSDPAQGASLDTAPATVSLTFNEPVQGGFTTLTVIGPDQADYHTGTVNEVDDTVSVGVLPLGPAGTYELGYRVVSADGHPVSGAVSFALTKAGPGSGAARIPDAAASGAAAAAAPPAVPTAAPGAGSEGSPVWPWIVGAVVLLGGGVAAALRLGRS